MHCNNCGKIIKQDAGFCNNCGATVINNLDNNDKPSQYKGLGGWLILVIIGLFLAILWISFSIYESTMLFIGGTIEFYSNPASGAYISGYVGVVKYELIGAIIFLVLNVYLVYLFFKKSKKFPKYFVLLMIASILFTVIDYLLVFSLAPSSDEMKQIIDQMLLEQETGIGREAIRAVVWGLYMLKSKRVKVTFTEDI